MTMRVLTIFISVALMTGVNSCTQDTRRKPSAQPYFGLQSATETPAMLAEGFILTELSERDGCFSSDGTEFYYSLWTGSYGAILWTRLAENGWTDPEIVSFSGQYSDLEPFVTPQGDRLYFASNRPLAGTGEPKDYDIWYVERSGNGWGEPVNVGPPVNSDKNEFYPSLTADGTLYVTARYAESEGGEDIFRFEATDAAFDGPYNLGPSINSRRDEFNAFVDVSEKFIIFSSFGREDGQGGGDLYVSLRSPDGSWKPARNLGPTINSPALDYCPWVSSDGRFFVFSSRRQNGDDYWKNRRSKDQLVQFLRSSQNGSGDIYVVNGRMVFAENDAE